MGLLIDTGVFIDIERAGTRLVDAFASWREEDAFTSAVTASELLHGVHRANSEQRRERRRRFVEWIFDTIQVLPFNLDAARVHARIWSDLKRQGQLIGGHDLLIAATALHNDLELVTTNVQEFERLEELRIRPWPGRG